MLFTSGFIDDVTMSLMEASRYRRVAATDRLLVTIPHILTLDDESPLLGMISDYGLCAFPVQFHSLIVSYHVFFGLPFLFLSTLSSPFYR